MLTHTDTPRQRRRRVRSGRRQPLPAALIKAPR